MRPHLLIPFFLFFFHRPLSAQCGDGGCYHDRFYVDTAGVSPYNRTFFLDSSYRGTPYYVADPKKFFDSLGVITMNRAMEIACQEEKFPTCDSYLHFSRKSPPVWELRGTGDVKFGGIGRGNARAEVEIVLIDAKTGKVLRHYRHHYRTTMRI